MTISTTYGTNIENVDTFTVSDRIPNTFVFILKNEIELKKLAFADFAFITN